MERVGTLIYKLLEQYEQQAQADKLMMTTQMLLTELQQYQHAGLNGLSKKVSVVIPSAAGPQPQPPSQPQQHPIPPPPPIPSHSQPVAVQPASRFQPIVYQPEPVPQPPHQPERVPEPEPEPVMTQQPAARIEPVIPAIQQQSYQQQQPAAAQPLAIPITYTPVAVQQEREPEVMEPAIPSIPPAEAQPNKGWQFDPVHDVPTLTHQENTPVYGLNEKLATKEESLNEKLRVEKIELGNKLQESPIRDLKKAIGINDRYLFINELFRGDETMYERSLKTINGFNILPEAQYWIQRELKVKLGWNEQSEAVYHFDQLVKRRFA